MSPIDLKSWSDFLKEFFPTREHSIYLLKELHMENDYLDALISEDEIIIALENSKNNKSPGADEIPYEFLRNLTGNWIGYLKGLFNGIMTCERIPRSWSQINVIMLHKKGDKFIHWNYRPIAMLNCVLKIFTQILSRRLNKWIENERLLPQSQAGF